MRARPGGLVGPQLVMVDVAHTAALEVNHDGVVGFARRHDEQPASEHSSLNGWVFSLVGARRRLAELLAVGARRDAGPLAEGVAE